ncbi:metal-sulfur cluster biosynthetic enzyme [Halogeometricum borinquense DSM 11551]|uniref:Metal-sulfur cluster biosynthetic enzyme n=2 Tax=Halogeometricum borinquense TaxID=60847 RepID=E4NWB7_HALBP|nr:1,2-phenylacetyl-CoA epoxidase subunit PaaD [Halogeometricum borinquense]ADQ69337.1 predicted metal-sulfur cluster biosynthetic enzyme [Halogeometricum borinquense DSM 11551]ELY26228.1 metal-sulfur cluster biosynthetic enzyme [Halogeometricum borinquense DSM 11551]RYJ19546.1 metal-sulfur cluster assembly factor [Halogeometricum borinquense]
MSSEFNDDGGAKYCAYTDYSEGKNVDGFPATGEGADGIERAVWDALYSVEDPEMPISIVDLGLIYAVGVDVEAGEARIDMTLTYTGCPARDMLEDDIREAVLAVEGIKDVMLNLVWSPAWSVEMVTEAGKQDLREFGLSI